MSQVNEGESVGIKQLKDDYEKDIKCKNKDIHLITPRYFR